MQLVDSLKYPGDAHQNLRKYIQIFVKVMYKMLVFFLFWDTVYSFPFYDTLSSK